MQKCCHFANLTRCGATPWLRSPAMLFPLFLNYRNFKCALILSKGTSISLINYELLLHIQFLSETGEKYFITTEKLHFFRLKLIYYSLL